MKLNQAIAVEKGIRNRADKIISNLYKTIQKPDLFAGMSRNYRAKDDEGDQYPSESVKVQANYRDLMHEFTVQFSKIADIVLTKEMGNKFAVADVKLGDTEFLSAVPVTYLLFLEKWLGDIHVFISKLPELEASENWSFDPQNVLYRTPTVDTKKTKKVPRVLVKFEPTAQHPGQSDVWMEDILEGYWENTKLSGKISTAEKVQMLKNVEQLIDAVKKAREDANNIEVTDQAGVGARILAWIVHN